MKIYTDGSCINNPGRGGWAFLILNNNGEELARLNSAVEKTTNNRMELFAAIAALYWLQKNNMGNDAVIDLYTDSTYVKNGITTWIHGWIKNNWRSSSGKSVLNIDLWQELLKISSQFKVNWLWVKAHNGDFYNEIVDNMARSSALS